MNGLLDLVQNYESLGIKRLGFISFYVEHSYKSCNFYYVHCYDTYIDHNHIVSRVINFVMVIMSNNEFM